MDINEIVNYVVWYYRQSTNSLLRVEYQIPINTNTIELVKRELKRLPGFEWSWDNFSIV